MDNEEIAKIVFVELAFIINGCISFLAWFLDHNYLGLALGISIAIVFVLMNAVVMIPCAICTIKEKKQKENK